MSDLLISMYEDFDKITDKGATLTITDKGEIFMPFSGVVEFMAKYYFIIKNMEDMNQFLLQYVDYRKEIEG